MPDVHILAQLRHHGIKRLRYITNLITAKDGHLCLHITAGQKRCHARKSPERPGDGTGGKNRQHPNQHYEKYRGNTGHPHLVIRGFPDERLRLLGHLFDSRIRHNIKQGGAKALQAAIDDPRRADKAGALLALTGVVNIPIIYFSVQWWNTLHQGASVSLTSAPTMAATMFAGMIVMALAAWMYSIAAVLVRLRCIILERERHTQWVRDYMRDGR